MDTADTVETQSVEAKAAKGAEVRRRVSDRLKTWVKDQHATISQGERHAFSTVRKKALEGQSEKGVMAKLRTKLEMGSQKTGAESVPTKTKMRMKVVGLVASVAAFLNPEPISKAALAATATGVGIAEKASEIKAMKDAHDAQLRKPPTDAGRSLVVERMMAMGGNTPY